MKYSSLVLIIGGALLWLAPGQSQAERARGGGELRIDTPVAGLFRNNPGRGNRGSATVDYTLRVTAPGEYQIDLFTADSTNFDPVLELLLGNQQVARDDDGGEGRNSRITQQLRPGLYTVRVNRFGGGREQVSVPYGLSVTARTQTPVYAGAIQLGVPQPGMFYPRLPTDDQGRPYQDFQLEVQQPGTYQLDLVSYEPNSYDPQLALFIDGREIARDDNGGDWRNARISRLLRPGTYLVRVTSSSAVSGRVPFALTVNLTAGPMPPGTHPPRGPQVVNPVYPGAPAQGVFQTNLPTDPRGRPYVDYTLTIQQPGRYQIDLRSSNTTVLDPFLILMDQNGAMLEENDDGGQGFNAQLTRNLAPGYYTIRVTRFGSGQIRQQVPFVVQVSRR
jgi:hypothetical protein